MQRYLNDPNVDAFQFRWIHFYGSFYRYRIDRGWFQKQTRVIKNNGGINPMMGHGGLGTRMGHP